MARFLGLLVILGVMLGAMSPGARAQWAPSPMDRLLQEQGSGGGQRQNEQRAYQQWTGESAGEQQRQEPGLGSPYEQRPSYEQRRR